MMIKSKKKKTKQPHPRPCKFAKKKKTQNTTPQHYPRLTTVGTARTGVGSLLLLESACQLLVRGHLGLGIGGC